MTDKTEHTPLPCPFCGKDPKVHPRTPKLDGGAWGAVRCNNIECFVNPNTDDGELISDERGSEAYRQAAIKRWNVRANQDTIAALLEALGEMLEITDGMDFEPAEAEIHRRAHRFYVRALTRAKGQS